MSWLVFITVFSNSPYIFSQYSHHFFFSSVLQDNYVSYSAALEMTGLQTLRERREKKCLSFSKNCIKHPRNSRFFPLNPNIENGTTVLGEKFIVNHGRTEDYRQSTIPYCQRMLNSHFRNRQLPKNIQSKIKKYD